MSSEIPDMALLAWKKSAETVLNGINLQAIARELDIKLGQDIGPQILPGIRALKAQIRELEGKR